MNSYSQNGEDLIVYKILYSYKWICNEQNGYMVELGAGDGTHFSNCKLFRELGHAVASYDADNKGNPDVIKKFITKENVLECFTSDVDCDFLSIDLDGNDFWILAQILKHHKPLIICCEVNSQLPLDSCIAINYNAGRSWDGSFGYGMSYKAAIMLLEGYGYSILDNVNNTNLIAVKEPRKFGYKYPEFKQTYSHPEVMPEGSYWVEVTKELIESI